MATRPERLDAAFSAVDRADFLPAAERDSADFDGPIGIGDGQTNSQPRTVRDMLRLLDVEPGQRVLDVGSGSGWTTALLAVLVGESGSVIGVELEPRLVEWGAENVAKYPVTWTAIRQADPDVLGAPDAAPFDRILVSAMAQSLPTDLVDQLAADGVMVIPVRGDMLRVTREGSTAHGAYRFVPLR